MNYHANFTRVVWVFRFLPLSVFVGYAFWDGTPSPMRWLYAFMLGGALALIQLVVFLRRREPINRLLLSSSLYLISGCAAVVMGWTGLLEQFNAHREVGVLAYMLAVGVTTTLLTPCGFVATARCNDSARIRLYSLFLCGATLMALFVSTIFKGHYLFSAVGPIAALVFLNKYFVRKLDEPERRVKSSRLTDLRK